MKSKSLKINYIFDSKQIPMKSESSIHVEKLELIQWLSTIEDLSILDKVLDLKNQENKDWLNSISETEKSSIEQGLQDAEQEKLIPHQSVKKLYDKWL